MGPSDHPAPAAAYVAAPGAALVQVRLDLMTAIFDRRSGQTHVVADIVPLLLGAMGDGRWTAAGLAAALARDYDLAAGPDAPADVVAARLTELAALGLVEQVAGPEE